MEELNIKVISYCSIPEEVTENTWLQELPCDCYTGFYVSSSSNDELTKWILKEYPELDKERILIDMDY